MLYASIISLGCSVLFFSSLAKGQWTQIVTLCRIDINRKDCLVLFPSFFLLWRSFAFKKLKYSTTIDDVGAADSHTEIENEKNERESERKKRGKRNEAWERWIVKSISWFIFVCLHQFTKRLMPMFSLLSNSNLNGYLHHFFHSSALLLDIR